MNLSVVKPKSVVPYDTNQEEQDHFVPYDTISLSREAYTALHSAFDHFNKELFQGILPECILTIRKKRGAHGFYAKDQFESRDGAQLDEIALNPESFKRIEIKAISTLVHEMMHLWQCRFGAPSRNGYHNKQWANAMEEIGLVPSSTGEPGGQRTGQRVSHYIIEGGAYEAAFYRWPMRGRIAWSGIVRESKPKTDASKTKYRCQCGTNVWGRPSLNIFCVECGSLFVQEVRVE